MSSTLMTGSFVSDGTVKTLSLPAGCDSFEMINITDIGSAAAATPVMKARFTSAMLAGSAYVSTKTNGAATLDLENTILANGFNFFDQGALPQLALKAVTGITVAAPGVVTIAGHGYASGDIVVLSGLDQMQCYQGIPFVITVINANTFSIINTNTAATPNPVTAGFCRKLAGNPLYSPRLKIITAITNANPMVVTTSTNHGYAVGAKIRLSVPSGFGMTQANGLLGTISVVTNTTFTLGDIDASAFTAFLYPVSAANMKFTQAQAIPVGEVNSILSEAEDNTGIRGIQIGTSVQTTAKTYQWFASKGYSL